MVQQHRIAPSSYHKSSFVKASRLLWRDAFIKANDASLTINPEIGMKKIILFAVLLLASCVPATEPSPAAATPIVNRYPTLLPTPTLAVQTKLIQESDREDAYNFFYELKNNVALRKFEHFAEEIRYPITVNVDGKPKTFIYVAEFESNFEKIFSADTIQKFISTDESKLTFTPDGVKVADGIIWFNLICMDPACQETEFMITEINN
jgi:hypothetical protein